MNVRLSRVEGGSLLRTDDVTGTADFLPTVGMPFAMKAAPIDPAADFRVVTTSNVILVQRSGDVVLFNTLNSIYSLDIL